MPIKKEYVWDPMVRLFHWSFVILFASNALVVDKDSDLRQWVGYGVFALVAFRLVWGFVGSRYACFASFPPSMNQSIDQLADMAMGRTHIHLGHTPFGALMIYNLLLTLLVLTGSGYLMTTDAFWGVQWPETVHKASLRWAEFSAILHILAVLFESLRTKVNLPRAMVTGYRSVPDRTTR